MKIQVSRLKEDTLKNMKFNTGKESLVCHRICLFWKWIYNATGNNVTISANLTYLDYQKKKKNLSSWKKNHKNQIHT